MSHTVTIDRDGAGWRVGSEGGGGCELVTAAEAERIAWGAVFQVGDGRHKPHGLRLKVVESCVAVWGGVLSVEQVRAWADDVLKAVEAARSYTPPELGAWGRVKKPQGAQR